MGMFPKYLRSLAMILLGYIWLLLLLVLQSFLAAGNISWGQCLCRIPCWANQKPSFLPLMAKQWPSLVRFCHVCLSGVIEVCWGYPAAAGFCLTLCSVHNRSKGHANDGRITKKYPMLPTAEELTINILNKLININKDNVLLMNTKNRVTVPQ